MLNNHNKPKEKQILLNRSISRESLTIRLPFFAIIILHSKFYIGYEIEW